MQIDARFNGPPTSGNGGWSAGSFAVAAGAALAGPIFEVTLRLPPPAPGGTCVVVGRAVSLQGRKALVDSSVYDPGGARLATARATWIAMP